MSARFRVSPVSQFILKEQNGKLGENSIFESHVVDLGEHRRSFKVDQLFLIENSFG